MIQIGFEPGVIYSLTSGSSTEDAKLWEMLRERLDGDTQYTLTFLDYLGNQIGKATVFNVKYYNALPAVPQREGWTALGWKLQGTADTEILTIESIIAIREDTFLIPVYEGGGA